MIITRHSRATKEHRASSKIEKLLLRCVIILILKIHYSNTEFFFPFFTLCACFNVLYAKYSPTACASLYCLSTLQSHFVRGFKRLSSLFFSFFVHSGDKENLIWNKSRNTFFIADNSNAFFFFIVWIYSFISLREYPLCCCM